MPKNKILSSIVGVIMLITIFHQWIGVVLMGCLGAVLWVWGKDLLR